MALATPSRRRKQERDRRVLVIDDDVNLNRVLKTILGTAGFEVLTAGDGEEALDLLDKQAVEVIVLDLRMPRMDGRAFYRELRARRKEIPVLIASAYGARSAQAELGAQASIEKPFDPDRLVEAVSKLLQGP